jgi:hypothetical protein
MQVVLSEKIAKTDFLEFLNITGLKYVGFNEFIIYKNKILDLISELSDVNLRTIIFIAIEDADEIKIIKSYDNNLLVE